MKMKQIAIFLLVAQYSVYVIAQNKENALSQAEFE